MLHASSRRSARLFTPIFLRWVPKGRVLQPELGFVASKRDIERFEKGAIKIWSVQQPKPLTKSFVEVVMEREPWRGNPRGQ
jgi:hypothetical protein